MFDLYLAVVIAFCAGWSFATGHNVAGFFNIAVGLWCVLDCAKALNR